MMTGDSWLTLGELAGYSKLSHSKLCRMVQNGDIPASRIASPWRFDARYIEIWMKSQRVGGAVYQANKDGNDGQMKQESF